MAKELKRSQAPSGGETIPRQGPQLRAPKTTPDPQRKEPNVVPPAEEGGIFSEIFRNILLLETGRKKKIEDVVQDALEGKTGQ